MSPVIRFDATYVMTSVMPTTTAKIERAVSLRSAAIGTVMTA
jgi:hypothetical protein